MAEAGLIISIASITIQITDSIKKLKDFWDMVKDAPEEIAYMIEEMEVLGLVMSDVERAIKSNTPSAECTVDAIASARCLGLCKRGAEGLEKIVSDLAQELEKGGKRAGFKSALKKNTIDRLRERLRNVQSLMVLSQQTYYQ
jgi:hypothetical protein